jgi:hypothetical protein
MLNTGVGGVNTCVNTLCSGLNEHRCEHIVMVNTKHRSGFVVAAVSVSCSGPSHEYDA